MKRLAVAILLVLTLALVACSSGDGNGVLTDGGGGTMPDGMIGPANLSGTWAQLHVQASVSEWPVVGTVHVQNRSTYVVTITHEGSSLKSTAKICSINVVADTTTMKTALSDKFRDSLPDQVRVGAISGGAGSYTVTFPKYTELRGIKLTDPLKDTMPTDPTDPRIFDQDGDGNPGMTVDVSGVATGKIYIIHRGWTILKGTRLTGNRIDGLLEWGDEQIVIGASSPLLKQSPSARPESDPQKSYFKTVRVKDGTDCATLRAQGESLFKD